MPLALLGSGQVQGVSDVLGGGALVEEVGVLEDMPMARRALRSSLALRVVRSWPATRTSP